MPIVGMSSFPAVDRTADIIEQPRIPAQRIPADLARYVRTLIDSEADIAHVARQLGVTPPPRRRRTGGAR